jgi:hypothetical protein
VLDNFTTEERSYVVHSCGQNDLIQRIFIKKIFPVYSGKCLSRKAVDNCVEKRGKRFADDEDVETEVRKWPRQQSKTSVLRVSTHW